MTTNRPPRSGVTADNAPLLVVAVCGGQRCRALRALQDDRSPGTPPSSLVISETVCSTKRSIMLSTDCLGPCAHGALVTVGWATMKDNTLAWLAPPTHWESTETPQHATTLIEWIRTAASSLVTGSANSRKLAG